MNDEEEVEHLDLGHRLTIHQTPSLSTTKNLTRDNVVVARDSLPPGSVELHFAVASGNLEVLEDILLHSEVPTTELVEGSTTEDGRTVLHIAASLGHEKMIRILVEAGANVRRATTKYGLTPLHLAAIKGHSKVIEELLRYLAESDLLKTTSTKTGHTALHLAALNGRLDTFKLLFQKLNMVLEPTTTTPAVTTTTASTASSVVGEKPLQRHTRPRKHHRFIPWRKRSCASYHSACASSPLVNLRAPDGSTLLHCAVAASVAEPEEEGEGTLRGSFNHDGVELLSYLLVMLNAEVRLSTKKGWTPLHLAAALGCEKACELLLRSSVPSSASRPVGKKKKSSSEKTRRRWVKKLLNMKTNTRLTPLEIAKLHLHSHLFVLLDPNNKK